MPEKVNKKRQLLTLPKPDLECLILKGMILEEVRSLRKTICYLILVLFIMLILSSADKVRYDNQLRFLDRAGYRSFTEDVPAPEESFYVFQGEAVVAEDVRGALICRYEAPAEVFLIPDSHADFEHTPFTRANLQGNDPESLREGEALISYDLSRRLHVRTGDELILFPWEGEGELEVKVAGIMKTKYRRGEIGYTGTILLRQNRSETARVFPDGSGVVFRTDETGSISIEEEKRECRSSSSLNQNAWSTDLLFPLSGFLLLGIVVTRECRRMQKRWEKRFLLLRRCGAGQRIAWRTICLLEGMLLLPAVWISSLLYRVLFMNLIAGEYMSFFYSLRQGSAVLAASFLISYAAVRLTWQREEDLQ